ncbi:MAG: PKD domain-containing protein [Prolixibacteraceae bacterium]|nr:PKD domain-containing protein [Prolixibacteraceae bacterium]
MKSQSIITIPINNIEWKIVKFCLLSLLFFFLFQNSALAQIYMVPGETRTITVTKSLTEPYFTLETDAFEDTGSDEMNQLNVSIESDDFQSGTLEWQITITAREDDVEFGDEIYLYIYFSYKYQLGWDGFSREILIQIIDPNDIPIASFQANPVKGATPLEVSFENTSTGTIDSYLWDFGDGSYSTEQNPVHTYNSEGTFSVSLEVQGLGEMDEMIKENLITVELILPIAGFTADNKIGNPPLNVEFNDISEGTINSWLWDFGDGGSSTEQNPVHIYENNGEYTVSLTVTNANGSETKTKENYILITDKDPIGKNGQWTEQELPIDAELKTISFIDKNIGWILGEKDKTTYIFSTVDGGNQWNIKYHGKEMGSTKKLIFTDKNNGWLIGNYIYEYRGEKNGEIFHSSDGGETWNLQKVPEVVLSDPNAKIDYTQVTNIVFVDSKVGWAVAHIEEDDPSYMDWAGAVLYKTINGGETWTQNRIIFGQCDEGAGWYFSSVCFLDEQNGWICGKDGGFYFALNTNDGGTNWTKTKDDLYDCSEMFFVNKIKGWYIEGDYGLVELMGTSDGGENWNKIYQPGEMYDFHHLYFFYDEKTGYVISDGKILISDNSGEEWSELKSDFGEENPCISFVFPDLENGYFISKSKIYKYGYSSQNAISLMNNPEVYLFPNPAANQISVQGISAKNQKYSVLTADGNVVEKGILKNKTVDVSTLSPGIYLLVIHEESFPITSKFVKQ